MDKLDPDDSRPPYLQVGHLLRGAIEAGTYAPGAQLPSIERLADDYGVATGTVKRALGVLRDEGLIITRQGMGTYVRTHVGGGKDHDELADIRSALADLATRLEAVELRLSGK
jgi:DNA-binding GntR family transcriptional regulator